MQIGNYKYNEKLYNFPVKHLKNGSMSIWKYKFQKMCISNVQNNKHQKEIWSTAIYTLTNTYI